MPRIMQHLKHKQRLLHYVHFQILAPKHLPDQTSLYKSLKHITPSPFLSCYVTEGTNQGTHRDITDEQDRISGRGYDLHMDIN